MNFLATRQREHSRKPDELYPIIKKCSWGPNLELFARTRREGWTVWGNEAPEIHGRFSGKSYGAAYSDTTSDEARAQLALLEERTPYKLNRSLRKTA